MSALRCAAASLPRYHFHNITSPVQSSPPLTATLISSSPGPVRDTNISHWPTMPTTSFAPAAAAPAPPAQPILASTLYSLHLTRRSNAINPIPIDEIGNGESRPPRKRRKLATGFKKLDREVLEGGLEVGEGGVVCLSLPSGREDSGDEVSACVMCVWCVICVMRGGVVWVWCERCVRCE